MAALTGPLTVPGDKAYDWFAILLLLGLFAFLGATFYIQPKLPSDAVTMVLGAWLTWIGTVVGYRWGSSVSSRAKDDTIKALSKGP